MFIISIVFLPIVIVFVLTNLDYKKVTTILLMPVLSIIGGLFSSIISTPGFFVSGVIKVEVSNEQILQSLLIHSLFIFFLVLIYYPFLKNRLKRKKDNVKINVKSSHTFKSLFKRKDQSDGEKQKEWIDKNFK